MLSNEDNQFIRTAAELEDPFTDVTPPVMEAIERAIQDSIQTVIDRDSAGRFVKSVTIGCNRCGNFQTAYFYGYQSPIQLQATIYKLLNGPCPVCYVADTGDYESVEAADAGLSTQELENFEGLGGMSNPDVTHL